MEKFAKLIIKGRFIILSVFIILVALCAVGYFYVNINSDVTSYLDKETMTSKGKEMLGSKFGIIGEMSIAVSNVTMEQMSAIVGKIETDLNKEVEEGNEKTKLIQRVAWLGTFDAMAEAINSGSATGNALKQGYKVVQDKFYYSKSDTYIVFLYLTYPNSEQVNMTLIDDIDALLKNEATQIEGLEYSMGGGAVNAKSLLESSIGEIPKYLVVAVVLILIILLITTKSFIEPLIFLSTLGVAILLNVGSNALMSSVSSITFAASTILQLAISMDFAIFLMHTFYEEKSLAVDTKTAIIRAIPRTIKSVSASALTTIGGFFALFIMRFGMGFDLGLVLAKGVLFSLLSVLLLQPILIYFFDKPIMRTQHKYFNPQLKRTSGLSVKYRFVIIIVCFALAIPACILQFKVPLNYLQITEENPSPTASESVISYSDNQILVLTPYKSNAMQYVFLDELKKINDEKMLVSESGEVRYISVFSMCSVIDENILKIGEVSSPALVNQLKAGFISEGYMMYSIRIDGKTEDNTSYLAIDMVVEAADSVFGNGNCYVTGMAQGAYDLSKVTPTDFLKVSLLSALIIFVILLITYCKTPLLSLILLLVVEIGIWINLAIVTLVGVSINFMSYIIISSIELGATVDYAILLTNNFLERKKKNPEWSLKKQIKESVTRSSSGILISASILISSCIAVYFVTSNVIVGEITMLIARGSILSAVLVLTLLPALLYVIYDAWAKIKEKRKPASVSDRVNLEQTNDESFAVEANTDIQSVDSIEHTSINETAIDENHNDLSSSCDTNVLSELNATPSELTATDLKESAVTSINEDTTEKDKTNS